MEQTTNTQQTSITGSEPAGNMPSKTMRNPQAVAWTVVLTSFVLFCVVCAAGTFATYWFFFDSTVGLKTTLVVSRGVVTVILPDGTGSPVLSRTHMNPEDESQGGTQIAPNSEIQVGTDAQGYITFEDGYTGQTVGRVFLLPNSTVVFREASRPRFEWSKQHYIVLFTGATGRFSVDIPENLSRTIALHVQSQTGVARMEGSGSYEIAAIDPNLTLHTRTGMGFLYVVPTRAQRIMPGEQSTLKHGESEALIEPYPLLMLNTQEIGPPRPTFGTLSSEPGQLPINWGCGSTRSSENQIEGNWGSKPIDQQMALHIERRAAQELGPASTDCMYYFPRLRADQYQTLSILLKMKIIYQDVTTCGIVGSECPIMLEMKYVDVSGNEQFWRQGFYAIRPPSDTYIQRCDTCPHDHQQIAPNAWYIYSTGDFKTQFPPEKAIDYIIYVKVYASGHQYEVALSEVMVLGSKLNQVPAAN